MINEEPDQRAINTLGLSRDCINTILGYQYLEQQVRRLILSACKPFCLACSDCCCEKDFCSESLDSYWLKMTWEMWGYDRSQYDETHGWLLSDGCRLVTGRPPVCYEYLCTKILSDIPGITLDILKKVSMQLSFTGKNALGNRHLITLSAEQILTRMNFNKLRRQIAKSLNLLQRYETEIAFHGDVINTASRIQEVCNRYKQSLLVSESFEKKLSMTNDYKKEFIGNVPLKGKVKNVKIIGIGKA